ncbi:hypothetical protein MNBD_GAMMA18-2025 [hydrothermal vent metagenome]|uniref:J domain-containing protein n=1 Tax=hydrothermal vent metagenome TaxID=652676 RepID=A0A3B1A9D0_9ZZZZ
MMVVSTTNNYFELFQLPVQYTIDKSRLSEAYRELQRVVHPDRFVGASDYERRLAQQKSTLVNDGYQVLRDDLSRAQHLLHLNNVDYQQHVLSDSGFLMAQIELREELEAIAASKDVDKLSTLFSHIQQQQENAKERLQAHFSSSDHLQSACDEVIKLQFLGKLCEEAEVLEERLL